MRILHEEFTVGRVRGGGEEENPSGRLTTSPGGTCPGRGTPWPMYGVVVIYVQLHSRVIKSVNIFNVKRCSLYPHLEEIMSCAGILTTPVANVNLNCKNTTVVDVNVLLFATSSRGYSSYKLRRSGSYYPNYVVTYYVHVGLHVCLGLYYTLIKVLT
jgi:hypothetical protein